MTFNWFKRKPENRSSFQPLELISLMLEGKINIPDFVRIYPAGQGFCKKEIIESLEQALINHDDEKVDFYLIAAGCDGLTKEYSKVLCLLLLETWHFKHEEILVALEEIRDPETIQPIVKSLELKLNYYTGNDIPRKAIWALGAIDTPESINEIKKLTISINVFTRGEAVFFVDNLKGKDLGDKNY